MEILKISNIYFKVIHAFSCCFIPEYKFSPECSHYILLHIETRTLIIISLTSSIIKICKYTITLNNSKLSNIKFSFK